MATLKSAGRELRVPCRCLIGRSALAECRLESRRGSSEHASLGYYSGRWILRDLGSSNGTRINGKALFPGDRVTVEPNSRIQFGEDGEEWTFADDAAPDPCAVRMGPQTVQWGVETLLVLPSADAPEASAFADAEGWKLDTGAETRAIECGDVVSLASGYWRLLVPERAGLSRLRTAGPELDVTEMSLSFFVAPERISVVIEHGVTSVTIPSRACLNTLIALARARLHAVGPESERGWVSSVDLAETLHCSPEKVNVDVHRLRKLFQEAGVRNAPHIVERDDAKRIRIRVRSLKEVKERVALSLSDDQPLVQPTVKRD
jgi:FHA domain